MMSYMHPKETQQKGVRGRLFKVVLHYREPTYEARNGRREHPYRFSTEVVAIDQEHAREKATAELFALSAKSGVSWIIQVERSMVTEN